MKKVWLGILLIITTVFAVILNFNSALQGRSAVLLDCIVTAIFVLVWVAVFIYVVKQKEYNLILPAVVFWSISLITTIVVIIINIYDLTINFIIPFVVIFLTPLYGIRVLGASYIFALLLMSFIAAFFVVCGIYAIIIDRKKKVKRMTDK